MEARLLPIGAALATAAALSLTACGGGGGDDETTTAAAPPVNALPAAQRTARLDRIVKIGEPTSITTPPGSPDTLFVTTKPGVVELIDHGKVQDEPFLDDTENVNDEGSEQGMFAIAFAPDYAQSGKFYVSHNNDDNSVQIDEYQRSADDPLKADPESLRPILNAPHGKGQRTQHNGGELQFGPDGLLYFGLGDGGPVEKPFVSGRGQERTAILGKLLRIDPAHPSPDGLPYTIPKDNPFVANEKNRERGEIYSYGLRNPYRFSFDSKTGALAIGDVGAANVEEIDYVEKGKARGANFGWPHFEGNRPFRTDFAINPGGPLTKPIHTYNHDTGCSVIGGYVVHDARIPALDGQYVYGDACSGDIRAFTPTPSGSKDDHSLGLRLSPTKLFGIVSFGQGSDGRVYAASFSGGVYALNPEPNSGS
ncbi:MAG: PQQ-dependent sugar dehydrogenase [Solirubrobacterales bacterium]|nr:PQQ-dependent sugar dehydrogenase [Solirubrobacterales bacterium]